MHTYICFSLVFSGMPNGTQNPANRGKNGCHVSSGRRNIPAYVAFMRGTHFRLQGHFDYGKWPYCHFAYSRTVISPTPNDHTVILPTALLVSRLHLMTYCHFAYSPTGILPTPNSHTAILPTSILVSRLHLMTYCHFAYSPTGFLPTGPRSKI